jgi:hypothetical protein
MAESQFLPDESLSGILRPAASLGSLRNVASSIFSRGRSEPEAPGFEGLAGGADGPAA